MAVARGRHAPPPDVRRPLQRERLLRAAAIEFAQRGYRGTSSDTISRRAGMSKATFYEHFANKEECMLELYDAAVQTVQASMARAAGAAPRGSALGARERVRAGSRAFLAALSENPEYAQTLLVEIIGAGPRATERRDTILQGFAAMLDAENAAGAQRGLIGRFASPHDSFAVVGAIVELVARQVRLGVPQDVNDLAPVIDRLIFGLIDAALAPSAGQMPDAG
jgi:AcrR family transcriptional regulator